jgi:putative transcriptional regulator
MENVLAKLRLDQGWTQADLARLLGVGRQTVISLEKGKYDPSLPLAFRIAGVFSCAIEDVFQPVGTQP